MAYVLKDGQGSLFKNENKTSDNHPNARGELMIDGVLYEVAAWTKQGSKGPFQSLSVKRKEVRQTVTAHNGEVYDRKDVQNHIRSSPQNFSRDLDDDLPF